MRRENIRWIDVSPSSIRPDAYAPYGLGEIDGLFDWGEDPNGKAVHVAPWRGQLIVDIVAFDPNAVHQPHKPGDEIVLVLEGTLILTTDADRSELIVEQGRAVLIPSGWAGLYRVASPSGTFREFTIVPGDYFDGTAPLPNDGKPHLIDPPTGDGVHPLFRNRYSVEADNRAGGGAGTIAATGDTIILVTAGTLSLDDDGEAHAFAAEDAVVLPAGSNGRAVWSEGYRGLIARWLD